MSFSAKVEAQSQAINTIDLFATIPETSTSVITADLTLIEQWSTLRKIFMCCSKDRYLRQLHPHKATEEFKTRLSIIMASGLYLQNQRETCRKACATFNRLILRTNSEVHPSKRSSEAELRVDLCEEEQKNASSIRKSMFMDGVPLPSPASSATPHYLRAKNFESTSASPEPDQQLASVEQQQHKSSPPSAPLPADMPSIRLPQEPLPQPHVDCSQEVMPPAPPTPLLHEEHTQEHAVAAPSSHIRAARRKKDWTAQLPPFHMSLRPRRGGHVISSGE